MGIRQFLGICICAMYIMMNDIQRGLLCIRRCSDTTEPHVFALKHYLLLRVGVGVVDAMWPASI